MAVPRDRPDRRVDFLVDPGAGDTEGADAGCQAFSGVSAAPLQNEGHSQRVMAWKRRCARLTEQPSGRPERPGQRGGLAQTGAGRRAAGAGVSDR
jgi:hypothetical protein